MISAIMTFFSKKIVVIVTVILALVGVVAGPVAIWQTARIDGVSVFGWSIMTGYKANIAQATAARDAAVKDYGQCKTNRMTLQSAIDGQNASIKALGDQTSAKLAAQAKVVAAAEAARKALADKMAAYLASPPSGADECARYRNIDSRFLEWRIQSP